MYKSNNFAAFISLIIFLCLITINNIVKNKKFKYSSIFFLIVFFPIIYFLFFNTFTVEESSRKLLKEGFAISNIDFLERNQFGESPIDENRFYEVILNENSDENISASLVYLVNKYHFSQRNNLPNLTSLISSIASQLIEVKNGEFFLENIILILKH